MNSLFPCAFVGMIGSAIIIILSVIERVSIFESKISPTSNFELDELTSFNALRGNFGDTESSINS